MITLTATAIAALLQHTAQPAFQVSIEYHTVDGKIRRGGGATKDLTHLVTGFPSIRTSLRPTERIPELSNITLKLFNENNVFNVTDATSWVGDTKWHRARLTIKMGVEIGQSEEVPIMAVAEMDDVIANLDKNEVELSLVDPFARLKGDKFGNAEGNFQNKTPTAAVEALLIGAGFESDLDTTSFDAAKESDEELFLQLHRYDLSSPDAETSWWDAILFLLGHTNRGLFWNSLGKIELFRLGPTVGSSVYTFNRTLNSANIKMQNPGGSIINKINIFIQKPGTEEYVNQVEDDIVLPPPGPVLGKPRLHEKNQDSIDVFGTIQQDIRYAWTWGSFGEIPNASNQARLLLDVLALAPKVFTITASLETFVVEIWDYVRVLDTEAGIDTQGFVFEKNINYEAAQVTFKVFDIPLNDGDWLQTNNSQNYDTGVPIVGNEGQVGE